MFSGRDSNGELVTGTVDLSDLQAQTTVTDGSTDATVSFQNGALILLEGAANGTISDMSRLGNDATARIRVMG
jgi:hypothetical protein